MGRLPDLSEIETDVEFMFRAVPLHATKQAKIREYFESLSDGQRYVLGTALTMSKNGTAWIPRGTAMHGNRLNATHYQEAHEFSLFNTRAVFDSPEWRWLDVIAQSIVLAHDEAEDSATLIKKHEPNRAKHIIRKKQVERVSTEFLAALSYAQKIDPDDDLQNLIETCHLDEAIPFAIDLLTPDKPSRAKNRGSYVNVADRITQPLLEPAHRFASLFAMLAKPADRMSNQSTLYAESSSLEKLIDIHHLRTEFERARTATNPNEVIAELRNSASELSETEARGYTVSSGGRVKEIFKGFLTADRFLDHLIKLESHESLNDYELVLRDAVLSEITALSELTAQEAERNALVLAAYDPSIENPVQTYLTIDAEAKEYVALPAARKLQVTAGRHARNRFHATIKRLNDYERKRNPQQSANYEANSTLQLQDFVLFRNYLGIMADGLLAHEEDPEQTPLYAVPHIEDDIKEFLTRKHR